MIIHNKSIIIETEDMIYILNDILEQATVINEKKALEADHIVFPHISPTNTFLGRYIHMTYEPVTIEIGPHYY